LQCEICATCNIQFAGTYFRREFKIAASCCYAIRPPRLTSRTLIDVCKINRVPQRHLSVAYVDANLNRFISFLYWKRNSWIKRNSSYYAW